MNSTPNIEELFEQRQCFPDFDARDRLNRLVGLEDQKSRLSKMLGILINNRGLQNWLNQHHKGANQLVDIILRRPPLLVLSGDVGSGKTELAETIGDQVARQEDIEITLFPLSLSSRGQGRVGEMTKLVSSAFQHTIAEAKKLKAENGSARGGIILLVDEADALAQSRESSQMHHEDRAGVNAFIRGIDQVANQRLPMAVIMCTNRVNALDPAVKRRAADILSFTRPNIEQRLSVISAPLHQLGFNSGQIQQIALATGSNENRNYGFTFSDLLQRLVPAIVLDAYPTNPILPDRALAITQGIEPTPPFKEGI